MAAKPSQQTTIPIEGMHCASCVLRVENSLKKVPGVEVRGEPGDRAGDGRLRPAGLHAGQPLPGGRGRGLPRAAGGRCPPSRAASERARGRSACSGGSSSSPASSARFSSLRRSTSTCRSSPACPMAAMTVTSFALATPVQFWAGWQFYGGAWTACSHRAADMNTLIAVGTTAAYLYSVVATFSPGLFRAADVEPAVYFDTSAVIIALILFGRYLEARAKGQTSAAIKRLMGLQARTARVVRDGDEVDIPGRERRRRRRRRRAAGREDTGRRRRPRRPLRRRRVDDHRREHPGREGPRRRGHRRDDQQDRQLPLPRDEGRARTPCSPRSSGWWRRRRARRRRSSAWPTWSRATSCRPSSASPR